MLDLPFLILKMIFYFLQGKLDLLKSGTQLLYKLKDPDSTGSDCFQWMYFINFHMKFCS